MAARAESYRYERKFLVPANSWATIEPGIKHNPGIFSSLYHPRTVNNIYLDSPALRLYFMNLEGAAERTKVRIRWYGVCANYCLARSWNSKASRVCSVRSTRFHWIPFRLDNSFTGESLRRVLQGSDLPDGVRQLLSDLEPTLVNCFPPPLLSIRRSQVPPHAGFRPGVLPGPARSQCLVVQDAPLPIPGGGDSNMTRPMPTAQTKSPRPCPFASRECPNTSLAWIRWMGI